MQPQPNYNIEGMIFHDEDLNPSTLEFRLDNEDVPNHLFQIQSSSNAGLRVLTFRLKDNARIDIYARWYGKPLMNFLTIDNLVYGPHTL